jgi:zinc protease
MLPVVERDLVDGVPVLRSTGVAGRHAAALVFRVGQFDETLPNRGITHMVEHLTFGGHHEARYQFNASVDGWYTRYMVESQDPADIADYLRAV